MDKALNIICIIVLFSHNILTTAYTLTPSQSISDGQTLVSQRGKFELGFFSPSSSSSRNRYLGIWHKTIPVQTVVWVANREAPVPDASGVVKIDTTGNIVILNKQSVIWSSNSSTAMENPIIELLESGNLIVRDARNTDSGSYIWQSFDYPGDTMLPGMKLGWNLRTGMNRYLSSWRNFGDPSRGDFTYGIELSGSPEFVMLKGSTEYYHGGSQNLGAPGVQSLAPFITYDVVRYSEEIFLKYQLVNQSTLVRFVLDQSGTEGRLQIFIWVDSTNAWVSLLSVPKDSCDAYALCGVYGTCDVRSVDLCKCLKGFKPKSPEDWTRVDWSQGCEREVPINCSNGEGFQIQSHVTVPGTTSAWSSPSMTLDECRIRCLKNCSCTAYSNLNIIGGGSGCIMWVTDLVDIKQLETGGQDLYIRMPSSELAKDSEVNSTRKKILTTIASVASFVAILMLGFASWYVRKKRALKGGIERDDLDLPLYTLATIIATTNNFSAENKLGEGGFGPVYKGKIEEGQEIAVKRLSKDSTQGVVQFKNEVMLISKLQHINLVRLLGCCIEGEEKMLVYEYMPNNSLDFLIFDKTKRRQLEWQMRFQIIRVIAGGLQYLHYDSRLKIIHRDLKVSNILLDSKMVPKISDFGMARIFGVDQVDARTKRVVGTYGYMSPEYLIEGHFSEKSDVFSFGVIVLEIISGRKNWGFRHPNHELNLVGHAWTLCNEDRCLEFADESLRNSTFVQDVIRCIHIGLLCVQREIDLWPTMSSVVMMLSSETAVLPRPQQAGFYLQRTPVPPNSSNNNKDPHNTNGCTVTLLEGH